MTTPTLPQPGAVDENDPPATSATLAAMARAQAAIVEVDAEIAKFRASVGGRLTPESAVLLVALLDRYREAVIASAHRDATIADMRREYHAELATLRERAEASEAREAALREALTEARAYVEQYGADDPLLARCDAALSTPPPPALADALARADRAEAERDEAKKRAAEETADANKWLHEAERQRARARSAEAERDRLREALSRIADVDCDEPLAYLVEGEDVPVDCLSLDPADESERCGSCVARAALAPEAGAGKKAGPLVERIVAAASKAIEVLRLPVPGCPDCGVDSKPCRKHAARILAPATPPAPARKLLGALMGEPSPDETEAEAREALAAEGVDVEASRARLTALLDKYDPPGPEFPCSCGHPHLAGPDKPCASPRCGCLTYSAPPAPAGAEAKCRAPWPTREAVEEALRSLDTLPTTEAAIAAEEERQAREPVEMPASLRDTAWFERRLATTPPSAPPSAGRAEVPTCRYCNGNEDPAAPLCDEHERAFNVAPPSAAGEGRCDECGVGRATCRGADFSALCDDCCNEAGDGGEHANCTPTRPSPGDATPKEIP